MFDKVRIKYRFVEDVEPHEILLDKLVEKREEEWGISERRIEVPLLKKVLYSFLFFSILVIFLLFLRTFQFQVIEGENFLALANENKYILHKIQAERGIIYDRNLKQLVFNLPSFNLFCEKNNLPEDETKKEKVLNDISNILRIEYRSLKEKIKTSEDLTILVQENLDHESLIILETKINELPGFNIEQSLIRDYIDGSTFSHLIGYMGKIKTEELKESPEFYSILDYVGRTGIEEYYESFLRKNPGKIRIERDALGNIISKETINLPESGKSLVLWLDSDLQKKINEVLEMKLQEIGSKKAIAVALDPKTGGVLSIVSIPSFDNNVFSIGEREPIDKILGDKDNPLFNRVIGGIGYPTGSTIKPLVASAALQENTIFAEKNINCQGLIEVEHEYDPEITYKYHDWNIHGWTNLRKAIAESCNVYFYSLGGGNKDFGINGLGPENIKKYLSLFGWGKQTGIDLPNEGEGILPIIDRNWRLGNTYHFSIGQGPFSITPLQVVNSFAAIANGGKLLQPRVVQKVIDISQDPVETITEIKTEIIRENFIDSKNFQIVREGMRQAVTGENSPQASAKLLNSLPVSSAAKTGTAETPFDNFYHNWVTVFAPYENPEIVLTIIIENVEGVRAASVPVAFEILNWYFSR